MKVFLGKSRNQYKPWQTWKVGHLNIGRYMFTLAGFKY